MTGRDWES